MSSLSDSSPPGFGLRTLGAGIVHLYTTVGGVLAFSVSGRIREFGIRLAMGSPPSRLLTKVIAEGALMRHDCGAKCFERYRKDLNV